MSKKQGIQMRSEYLNFLRFRVTETAAATFTESEIDTNLSAERGVMMEIHSVELFLEQSTLLSEVPAAGEEDIHVQITRETKTAIANFLDADVVARFNREVTRSAAIGTDAGPLYLLSENVVKLDFPMPIPYVKPSIFVGIQGSDAATAQVVSGRIGYTLRDVDREDFLELLVALQ